jgi:hypothetical protein
VPCSSTTGRKFGEDKFLPASGNGRVVPQPLRWNSNSPLAGDFVGGRLFDIYRQLIAIRNDHPALRSPNSFPFPFNSPDGYGAFLDQDVVIYHRWGHGWENGAVHRHRELLRLRPACRHTLPHERPVGGSAQRRLRFGRGLSAAQSADFLELGADLLSDGLTSIAPAPQHIISLRNAPRLAES